MKFFIIFETCQQTGQCSSKNYMLMLPNKFIPGAVVFGLFIFSCCSTKTASDNPPGGGNNPPPVGTADVASWITRADASSLLEKQATVLSFGKVANSNSFIDVDSTQQFQTIDGFGYTLTGGSASVIKQLSAADKSNLLKELFGMDDNSIRVSYLRISIGASDLDASVFSYDDVPAGQTDTSLSQFSLAPD